MLMNLPHFKTPFSDTYEAQIKNVFVFFCHKSINKTNKCQIINVFKNTLFSIQNFVYFIFLKSSDGKMDIFTLKVKM